MKPPEHLNPESEHDLERIRKENNQRGPANLEQPVPEGNKEAGRRAEDDRANHCGRSPTE